MTITRVLLIFAVVGAMAACGLSASTPQHAGAGGGATSSTVTTGGQAQSGSGSGGNTKAGKAVAICKLMPPATVARIVGEPISTAKEIDVPTLHMYECDYNTADSSYAMSLHVIKQDAQANYTSDVQGSGASKAVAGLGDKAAITTAGLDALFGDVLIRAQLTNGGTGDSAKKLVQALHDKL